MRSAARTTTGGTRRTGPTISAWHGACRRFPAAQAAADAAALHRIARLLRERPDTTLDDLSAIVAATGRDIEARNQHFECPDCSGPVTMADGSAIVVEDWV